MSSLFGNVRYWTGEIKETPGELKSECWYCGEFHITSEWRKKKNVEFISPCEAGHSPRTKVKGIDTICLTPPVLPQENE